MGQAPTTAALFERGYGALWRIAAAQMRRERPGTLGPTALLHEAYLRLHHNGSDSWNSPAHFVAAATEAMRRILVERARRRHRLRHGGGLARIPLDDDLPTAGSSEQFLALDRALSRLESLDARKAQVVKLRYLAGFTIEETARLLEVSPATVKLDWTYARAWILRAMSQPNVP
jgi:RNA polymerase sigma factor (TIGR02999 family)